MRNAQDLLRSAVLDRFERDSALRQLMLRAVREPVEVVSLPDARTDLLFRADAPIVDLTESSHHRSRVGRFVDFHHLESQRRDLGLVGELAVVAYEQHVLRTHGHRKLADRVEHVSATQGDGTGYDVLSFEPSGKEKFIEVKTTRSIMQLPFLVTRNEVEFSSEAAEQFHLYRVFQYGKPKVGFYGLQGPLDQTARLDPVVYQGRPA